MAKRDDGRVEIREAICYKWLFVDTIVSYRTLLCLTEHYCVLQNTIVSYRTLLCLTEHYCVLQSYRTRGRHREIDLPIPQYAAQNGTKGMGV